ncbi:MAG: tRNA threonylcarbamoyladenosine dehydratase [Bacteroidales bacterium]|nr:tRNA threonylcarbamoyladenosine dehydratase [Bacteroidales bacterium]
MAAEIFDRTERLLGEEMMAKLASVRVIIFGVGGVGSWCAEGLIRSGIGHLTMVDMDTVNVTNVNRQLMATTKTVGRVKVDVLRERLLEINPEADIEAVHQIYTAETEGQFDLDSYDYVIDAIDSLKDKAHLMLKACESKAVLFSSMGAACKIDPTKIRVAEFWNVRGCPLGAALRKKFKKAGTYPAHKFLCVYDDEVLPNKGGDKGETCDYKAVINGTTAHITGIFGLTISGLVLQDIVNKG